MLAYDYPLLGAFWTITVLALLVLLAYLVFWVFADIVRSPDMGGLAKALWILLVIVVPFLGFLIYMVARERMLTERQYREARERRAAG